MRLGIEANKLYDNMGVMLSRNENPGHFDTPFSIGIWSCSEAVGNDKAPLVLMPRWRC